MDRVRTELIAPLRIDDLRREARRVALADLAAHAAGGGPPLASRLGSLLIRAGCALESAAQRQTTAARIATVSLACGRVE